MSKNRAPNVPRTEKRKIYDKAKRRYTSDLRTLTEFTDQTPVQYTKTIAAAQERKLQGAIQAAETTWQVFEDARDELIDELNDEELVGIEDPDWFGNNTIALMTSKSKDFCQLLQTLFTEEDDDDTTKNLPKMVPAIVQERKALQEEVGTTLSNISVNRENLRTFKEKLSDQLVDEWDEDSRCKVYTGIEKERWPDFLEKLKRSAKLDDQTMADLEMQEFSTGFNDKLKAFTVNKPDGIQGSYGMYLIKPSPVEQDEKERVDVAFSLFNFKTKLMGIEGDAIDEGDEKPRKGRKGKGNQSNNFFGSKKPFCTDILTGEEGRNRRLRLGDINSLSENFIVWKALSGFASSGVIPFVKFDEDSPNYDQDQLTCSNT